MFETDSSTEDLDGLPGTEKVWELDDKELVIDTKPFARGAFSRVHKGEYFGTSVCVKVLKKDDSSNNELFKFIRREVSSLKFSHPNIVHLIGVAEKQDEIYIVTEYVAGGNLRQFLKDRSVVLPWELRLQIATDIASGMAFLHSKNVMHRDLKSKNLLVEDNWHIKVCDFGFARSVHSSRRQLMTVCGTGEWMAPEVMMGHPYDFKADVFSFGMVLVEILTRAKVGEDVRRIHDTQYGLDKSIFESMVPGDCPSEFLQLTLQCCVCEPHVRPTFKDITKRLKAIKGKLESHTHLTENNFAWGTNYSPPSSPPILANRKGNQSSSFQAPPASPILLLPSVVPPALLVKKKEKGFLRMPLSKQSHITHPDTIKSIQWTSSWDTPSIRPAIQEDFRPQRVVSANPLYQPVFSESRIHDHRNISAGRVHFEK
jgi:serine/threonine protein kinase